MIAIFKTPPVQYGLCSLPVHEDAIVLSCEVRQGQLCTWYKADSTKPMTERRFFLVGTGQNIPPELTLRFISTIEDPANRGLVWHVFEVIE